jgi:hypothetical protein
MNHHRVDLPTTVVRHDVAQQLHGPDLRVHFDFDNVAAIGEGRLSRREIAGVLQTGRHAFVQ